MTRKKNKPQKPLNKPIKSVAVSATAELPLSTAKPDKTVSKWLLLIAVVATLIVFFPSLFNGFVTNWDDSGYIHDHAPIHKINAENLKTIFTTYHKGNYHPLTLLTYALEYSLVELNPFLYHLNNLILHLLNVVLVFIFIKKLTSKKEIAFITALFFGIHPMRVESVAWISERKDVLYTFFFFLSANFYIDYIQKQTAKARNYLLSLLFIVLSLLSKPAAVCFPGVVVIIDWFLKRKYTFKVILEKVPYFVIGLVFGIIAIYSQEEAGAIQNLTPIFTFIERIFLSFYALVRYLEKLVLPLNLSAMHPYPDFVGGRLQTIVYLSPLIVIALLGLVLWSLKKNRMIAFGAAFFLVNIALVLQLLPVGAAIIAERYSYVPYIGLFMMIGYGYTLVSDSAKEKIRKFKVPLAIFLGLLTVFWSVLTIDRIGVWKRGDILFEDVVKKYNNINFAYNNLGYFYFNELKNNEKALYNYNRCLQVDSTFYMAYSNRAILLFNIGKPQEALIDFNKALRYKPDNPDALIGRANTLSTLEKFKESIPDYINYLKLKPNDANGIMWLGIAYNKTGKLDSAFYYLRKSLSIKPQNEQAIYWLGICYFQYNKMDSALIQFDKALALKPDYNEVYAWRAFTYFTLKNYPKAIEDYTNALARNPKDVASLVNRSVCYKEMGEWQKALADAEQAIALGYPVQQNYYQELKFKAGKK